MKNYKNIIKAFSIASILIIIALSSVSTVKAAKRQRIPTIITSGIIYTITDDEVITVDDNTKAYVIHQDEFIRYEIYSKNDKEIKHREYLINTQDKSINYYEYIFNFEDNSSKFSQEKI